MRKAFKYRLFPTRQQEQAMAKMLGAHRFLYNCALEQRKVAWKEYGQSLSYLRQAADLTQVRAETGILAETNFSSCQATLRRLDKAFQAFFRRLKVGEAPGYPRFKGRNRFDTVEFPSYGDGCKLDGERVYFQHVGKVKIKLHRLIEGKIKTVSFKHEPDGWHVIFSCDLGEVVTKSSSNPPVGIDLGLKAFLVTSNGQTVEPPKFYRQAQARLRRAQRRVSRRQKGSKRRRKAAQQVAKLHQHVANQRRDFHHKTALGLVRQYGAVVHEDLNVKGIARTRLAKSTHDVGWASFLNILRHKAEGAGVAVIGVSPHNTTQACSECGCFVPKTLSDRVHCCPHCGYEADRDLNAARNIVNRAGLARQALTQRTAAYVA